MPDDWEAGKNDVSLVASSQHKKQLASGLYNALTTKYDTQGTDEMSMSYGGFKFLDAVAAKLEHVDGTCVALCIFGGFLLAAGNTSAPDYATVIGELRKLDDPVGFIGEMMGRIKFFIQLGNDRGYQQKIVDGQPQARACLNLPGPRHDIHAEMRILEVVDTLMVRKILPAYEQAEAATTGGVPYVGSAEEHDDWRRSAYATQRAEGLRHFEFELYFGISKLCCGKCFTVVTAYNELIKPYIRVVVHGNHTLYPLGWRLPEGLRRLRTSIEYNKLKFAGTFG